MRTFSEGVIELCSPSDSHTTEHFDCHQTSYRKQYLTTFYCFMVIVSNLNYVKYIPKLFLQALKRQMFLQQKVDIQILTCESWRVI